MDFIGTGNRILTENFTIGYLYTITFRAGYYINSACIGKGADNVMFQRTEPELLFNLNMDTAPDVYSIELYSGGGGTDDYETLSNKPQINSITLTGNKSGSDLDLQSTISDLDTIRAGAAAGATAVQPADMTSALAAKQDALSTAQLDAVNSGITSTDVAQITANKNNISALESGRARYQWSNASTGATSLTITFSQTDITAAGNNLRGGMLFLFPSQSSDVENSLVLVDLNQEGVKGVRLITNGNSEQVTAISGFTSNTITVALQGNSYARPASISFLNVPLSWTVS